MNTEVDAYCLCRLGFQRSETLNHMGAEKVSRCISSAYPCTRMVEPQASFTHLHVMQVSTNRCLHGTLSSPYSSRLEDVRMALAAEHLYGDSHLSDVEFDDVVVGSQRLEELLEMLGQKPEGRWEFMKSRPPFDGNPAHKELVLSSHGPQDVLEVELVVQAP